MNNDEIYKFEYKNICYLSCSQYTVNKSENENIYELKCEAFENIYYNIWKNECINVNDIHKDII